MYFNWFNLCSKGFIDKHALRKQMCLSKKLLSDTKRSFFSLWTIVVRTWYIFCGTSSIIYTHNKVRSLISYNSSSFEHCSLQINVIGHFSSTICSRVFAFNRQQSKCLVGWIRCRSCLWFNVWHQFSLVGTLYVCIKVAFLCERSRAERALVRSFTTMFPLVCFKCVLLVECPITLVADKRSLTCHSNFYRAYMMHIWILSCDYSGAATAQWLRWGTCTQQSQVQVLLVPIWVNGGSWKGI